VRYPILAAVNTDEIPIDAHRLRSTGWRSPLLSDSETGTQEQGEQTGKWSISTDNALTHPHESVHPAALPPVHHFGHATNHSTNRHLFTMPFAGRYIRPSAHHRRGHDSRVHPPTGTVVHRQGPRRCAARVLQRTKKNNDLAETAMEAFFAANTRRQAERIACPGPSMVYACSGACVRWSTVATVQSRCVWAGTRWLFGRYQCARLSWARPWSVCVGLCFHTLSLLSTESDSESRQQLSGDD
jgi:hypothetical protein